MFSGQAYSFGKKARLAASLAWVGGFVDVVGVIELRVFTSNMTGNTAMIGQALSGAQWWNGFYVYALVTAFLFGAMLAGLLIEGARRLKYKSIYTVALAVEAVLLVAVVLYQKLGGGNVYVLGILPCLAMGLQNATITRISGSVVRTTHVTGIVTDLGLELVQFLFWLRDKAWMRKTRHFRLTHVSRAAKVTGTHPTFQRLILLAGIWTTFVTGAALGAIVWHYWQINALLLPVTFLVAMIVMERLTPLASVDAVDRAARANAFLAYGIEPDLVPPSVGIYQVGGTKGRRKLRAPDLGELYRLVKPDERVVILMLGEGVELDENAMLGLAESIYQIRSGHREVVICLGSREGYEAIMASGLGQKVGLGNMCSDPEFAVARALDLLHSDKTK